MMRSAYFLAAVLALTTIAHADDGDKNQKKVKPLKVKIDDLSADLRSAGPDWVLRVPYEIEVENARGGEQLTLQMYVLEDGAPLLDGEGREIVLAADLDCPERADEIDFDKTISVRVPKELIAWPYALKIEADIRLAGDNSVLDREDCSVQLKLPTVYVRRAYGVHVHYWR